MWAIETYRETGEFFKILDEQRWPKTEAIQEPVSDDLEIALEEFAKRYPSPKYHLGIAWREEDNVKFFFVEEFGSSYRNMVATLKKK
jgi:hypothetical protein